MAKRNSFSTIIATIAMVIVLSAAASAAEAPLMTRWAKDVTADNVHPEYPRLAMVRQAWLNLNGLWDYAILPADLPQPKTWQGKILVPFAAESALSGVMKRVSSAERLWYRRTFTVPQTWSSQRILLNFGAIDWHAIVWVNGQKIGEHKGCYDPFTFDITGALNQTGDQQIVISVWDPTDEGTQPRGKQVTNPKGIYYTPVTGIWQTVWIEPVPKAYIKSLKVVPDIDRNCVWVTADAVGVGPDHTVHAEATLPPLKPGEKGEKTGFRGAPGKPLRISLAKNPKTRRSRSETCENASLTGENRSKYHQNTAKRALFSHFLSLFGRRKQV